MLRPARACWPAHVAGAQVILTQNGRTADDPCVNIRARIGNKARAAAALAIHANGGPPGGYGFAILLPELVHTASTDNGPNIGAVAWPQVRAGAVAPGGAYRGQPPAQRRYPAWAKDHSIAVSERGRILASVVEQYQAAAASGG